MYEWWCFYAETEQFVGLMFDVLKSREFRISPTSLNSGTGEHTEKEQSRLEPEVGGLIVP